MKTATTTEKAKPTARRKPEAGAPQRFQKMSHWGREALKRIEALSEALETSDAEKALGKAIKANKGKPSIKADDLYAQCGL